MEVVCHYQPCNRVYHVAPSRVARSKYCGTTCRALATQRSLTCAVCRRVVQVAQCRKGQRYCSAICRNIAHRNPVEVECAYCGEIFEDKASAGRVYCGRKCAYLARCVEDE